MASTIVPSAFADAEPDGDGFDLDVRLVEVADAASLTTLTDDNCGSTCASPCLTNVV